MCMFVCVCVCVCGAKDKKRTTRKGSLGPRTSFGAFIIVGVSVFDVVLGGYGREFFFLSCE